MEKRNLNPAVRPPRSNHVTAGGRTSDLQNLRIGELSRSTRSPNRL